MVSVNVDVVKLKHYMTSRPLSNIIVILSILLLFGRAVPCQAGKDTKSVLVLYSQEKGHPAHDLTDQGLRAAFQESPYFDIQLYAEYLDEGRFPNPGHMSTAADFLRHKYTGVHVDAIITVYPYATDFLLTTKLFPGVPIIASEVSRSFAEKLKQSPARHFVTGTIAGDNITGLMNAALHMRPATKRVALVGGTTPNDAHSEQVFRQGLKPYMERLELIDLTKLSMEETLLRVNSLPPDTLVLYSSILRDGADKSFVPREALSLVARASNAPVFGLYETYIGCGIVGGRLVSFERHGREAATLALRVLSGEPPAAIPFGGEQAYVSRYDWRELKRWGILETAVPAEGVILYRQPSIWEQHRSGIIGVIVLTVSEGLLIMGLMINLRKRRKAEFSLLESKRDLQTLAERLIKTQEEELSRLARELHDDLTQRLAGLAIDAGILEKRMMTDKCQDSQELNSMKIKLIDASEDVHRLSRQLHPSILDDLGLVEAVKSESAIFSKRTGIDLSFEPQNMPDPISYDTALCLYRVIQEGMRNIEKHAKTKEAFISLQGLSGGIRLLIKDAGNGFDNKVVRKKAGLGLSSMRERVRIINGTMSIKSTPGKGTEVEVFVPVRERA